MLILWILLFAILILLTCLMYLGKKDTQLPPGPIGLPILGNLLQMVKNPHLTFSKWAYEYGELYTIKLATQTAVVLSSAKVLKEVLGTKAGTGKFKTDAILAVSNGPYGILHTEGSAWYEVRQFCIRSLKTFGYGNKLSWEALTISEVDNLIDWLKRDNQRSGVSIKKFQQALQNSANSSNWPIFAQGDATQKACDQNINRLVENVIGSLQRSVQSGLIFFPKLRYLFPERSGYLPMKRACSDLHQYIKGEFERHVQTFEEGKIRDLMDCYVEHLKTVTDPSSSFYGTLGYQNTISSFVELLIGSYETTGTTLTWAFVYLAVHPHIQKKVRDEIKAVVGFNRDPRLDDKRKLPYTEAVMLEIFRFSSLVPMGAAHELLEDLAYDKYFLPKGTILFPNLYHVHHNKATWGDPEIFRPERFLENEGLKDYVVPFQVGSRRCPGEFIARDKFFSYLTKLLQKFVFSIDGRTPKEQYLVPESGFLLLPRDNKLIITEFVE